MATFWVLRLASDTASLSRSSIPALKVTEPGIIAVNAGTLNSTLPLCMGVNRKNPYAIALAVDVTDGGDAPGRSRPEVWHGTIEATRHCLMVINEQ